MGFLILPYPLTNFEIQKYYKKELGFNSVFSRNNLPKKIKDGGYVLNLDEYADVGTHPEEIKKIVGNENIKANVFRVQTNDSVMCGFFCIGFIDFMSAGKKLAAYTNLFSPYDFKKNDNIILPYFKNE